MAKEYGSKGLVIAAPSLDAEATVLKFRSATKAAYPMLTDAKDLAKRYAVQGYPFIYLIGKDAKILWKGNWKSNEMIKLLESALAQETPAEEKPALTVYVLKDGRRLNVVSKMVAGDKLVLRDDQGKLTTVEQGDVAQVLKDVPAEATAETAQTPAAQAEPEAKPSKYPVLVLRDGRRITATMKMEAGDELSVKDDAGKMHTIKKADIVETIPAGGK